jgi:hypothetical protein
LTIWLGAVKAGEQLAQPTPLQHRHRDLAGVRFVGSGFDERLEFLWLHRVDYRRRYPDP